MIDMVYEAVGQAFIKSAPVMGSTVQNAVVKTFAEGTFLRCMGPSYMQPSQMNFASMESAVVASLSAPNSRPEGNNGQTSMQTAAVTLSPQPDRI